MFPLALMRTGTDGATEFLRMNQQCVAPAKIELLRVVGADEKFVEVLQEDAWNCKRFGWQLATAGRRRDAMRRNQCAGRAVGNPIRIPAEAGMGHAHEQSMAAWARHSVKQGDSA